MLVSAFAADSASSAALMLSKLLLLLLSATPLLGSAVVLAGDVTRSWSSERELWAPVPEKQEVECISGSAGAGGGGGVENKPSSRGTMRVTWAINAESD